MLDLFVPPLECFQHCHDVADLPKPIGNAKRARRRGDVIGKQRNAYPFWLIERVNRRISHNYG